jgi:hypothetical protein
MMAVLFHNFNEFADLNSISGSTYGMPSHHRSKLLVRRLLTQHVKIVLQIEDLLLAAVAAFMPVITVASMTQLQREVWRPTKYKGSSGHLIELTAIR